MNSAQRRFAWFAWAVLVLNIPVILWGAFVRASFSGDGCGAHWPFCNGQAVPQSMTIHTLVEFTHRFTSGVDIALVIPLVALAFWLYPKGHAVRRYAAVSLIVLLIEALIGAGLVMFRMVAHDQSAGRAWSLSAHLINTMLLLASMTMTAWLASQGLSRFNIRNANPGLLWSAIITVFVSITGALTALGDMLFPSGTLMEGMRRDLSSESPILLRLRVAHPAIAILGAVFVIWTALVLMRSSPSEGVRRAAMRLAALTCFQLFVGAANLSLLAPVWMQLTHLFIADLVWIAVVLAVAESASAAYGFESMHSQSLSRESAAGKPA